MSYLCCITVFCYSLKFQNTDCSLISHRQTHFLDFQRRYGNVSSTESVIRIKIASRLKHFTHAHLCANHGIFVQGCTSIESFRSWATVSRSSKLHSETIPVYRYYVRVVSASRLDRCYPNPELRSKSPIPIIRSDRHQTFSLYHIHIAPLIPLPRLIICSSAYSFNSAKSISAFPYLCFILSPLIYLIHGHFIVADSRR